MMGYRSKAVRLAEEAVEKSTEGDTVTTLRKTVAESDPGLDPLTVDIAVNIATRDH